MRGYRHWHWHLDEMYVKLKGKMVYLRSYGAVLDKLGCSGRQEVDRWANDRVENSNLPFRRRERAMLRFRQMKTLQKFVSVHANIHNNFNLERHRTHRQTYNIQKIFAFGSNQA